MYYACLFYLVVLILDSGGNAMKLNCFFIHYQLSKIIDVERISWAEKEVFVKRPIFFEKSKFISEHLVIIKPEMISEIPSGVHDVIFLCNGVMEDLPDNLPFDIFSIKKEVVSEQLFNVLQSIFDVFDEWDERLKEIDSEDMGYTEVVESCKMVTPSPISIIDTDFSYVAYSKESSKKYGLVDEYVDDYNYIPLSVVNEIISHAEYSSELKIKESFFISRDQSIVAKNVFNNEEYVGRISTMQEKDHLINLYNAAIFEHINIYIEKMYARYKGFHHNNPKMDSLHSMLTQTLEGQKFSMESWDKTLEKIKWKSKDDYVLVQLSPGHAYRRELYVRYFCPQIEKMWKGSCAFSYENRIIFLVNNGNFKANSKESFKQSLSYFLRESLTLAGISREFKNIENIDVAFEQTEIALKFGKEKDPMFWAFYFDDYALDYLVENGISGNKAEHVCHKGLLILWEHDLSNGTELYKTLFTLFKTNFNASEAADSLKIHRSTFLNRMERINSLTKINLDDWNTKLYLMISFQLNLQ